MNDYETSKLTSATSNVQSFRLFGPLIESQNQHFPSAQENDQHHQKYLNSNQHHQTDQYKLKELIKSILGEQIEKLEKELEQKYCHKYDFDQMKFDLVIKTNNLIKYQSKIEAVQKEQSEVVRSCQTEMLAVPSEIKSVKDNIARQREKLSLETEDIRLELQKQVSSLQLQIQTFSDNLPGLEQKQQLMATQFEEKFEQKLVFLKKAAETNNKKLSSDIGKLQSYIIQLQDKTQTNQNLVRDWQNDLQNIQQKIEIINQQLEQKVETEQFNILENKIKYFPALSLFEQQQEGLQQLREDQARAAIKVRVKFEEFSEVLTRYDELLCDKVQRHALVELKNELKALVQKTENRVQEVLKIPEEFNQLKEQNDFVIEIVQETRQKYRDFETIQNFQNDIQRQLKKVLMQEEENRTTISDHKRNIFSISEKLNSVQLCCNSSVVVLNEALHLHQARADETSQSMQNRVSQVIAQGKTLLNLQGFRQVNSSNLMNKIRSTKSLVPLQEEELLLSSQSHNAFPISVKKHRLFSAIKADRNTESVSGKKFMTVTQSKQNLITSNSTDTGVVTNQGNQNQNLGSLTSRSQLRLKSNQTSSNKELKIIW